MTPAITTLEAAGIDFEILEYELDRSDADHDLGLAAAQALAVQPDTVFKTLVAELSGGELVIAMIPVAAQLDMKALARTAGARSANLSTPAQAERATGYVTGGISPLGSRRTLRAFISEEAVSADRIHVSAGKRGLELRLDPADLIRMTSAIRGALSR